MFVDRLNVDQNLLIPLTERDVAKVRFPFESNNQPPLNSTVWRFSKKKIRKMITRPPSRLPLAWKSVPFFLFFFSREKQRRKTYVVRRGQQGRPRTHALRRLQSRDPIADGARRSDPSIDGGTEGCVWGGWRVERRGTRGRRGKWGATIDWLLGESFSVVGPGKAMRFDLFLSKR